MSSKPLRRGDLVEILSPAEILSTLSPDGVHQGLPFMPEMAQHCCQRFVVDARAEKICDTIKYTGSRRLSDTVFLAGLRCDGSQHGGCQAECRYLWKEAWLRAVEPGSVPSPKPEPSDIANLAAHCAKFVTAGFAADGNVVWSCQATSILKATERLNTFDPIPYVREFTCGNVSLSKFLRVAARAAIEEPGRKLGLVPEVYVAGPVAGKYPSHAPLDLKPGELVEVKSKEEIAATLNAKGFNKGLWFDREMLAYCGRTFRVRSRIARFIDDRFSKMVELTSDCVTLEGVTCTGEYSSRRWFCQRAAMPYWRECWLRRVNTVPGGSQTPIDQQQAIES